MCKRNVLTIVAVAILALAIGQVQAVTVTVTVPNSDFETLYKPGTLITGVVSGGGWTMGVGPDAPIDSGTYEFDDATTGDTADIPGWVGYDVQGWLDMGGTYCGTRDCTEAGGNQQGSISRQNPMTGLHIYLSNGGGWGNPAGGLIVSDASLGKVEAGIYTLSMFGLGSALPPVLELLVDGVIITPDSEVSPDLSGAWQEYSRTYNNLPDGELTIMLGVGRPLPDGATGAQSRFDDVSLSYELVPQATNPIPADGATDLCRNNVVLSWRPGMYADKHDVYFGTDFDDVNDATTTVDPNNVYKGRQDPDRYPIADTLNLDLGETYYWRIDEVNASPDFTIFKGGIWQFTIEPLAYPIAGDEITATASSSKAADQGPENTINGSGLDANDLHSTVETDMWLSGDEPNGAWIEYEFDNVYKLHEMWVWNHNTVFEGDLGCGLKDVTIEYSENGTDYMTLGTTHEFARAPGEANYEHNTEVYFGVPAKYVKLTANSNWEGVFDRYGLSEVRFFRVAVRAREESPESGTTIDGIDVVLSWRPGREAAEHNVYLSTSFEDVNTGTIAPDIIDAAGECETTYGPLSLELGKTYYWKVNEVNDLEEPSTWQGDVWNFATPEYFVVDDMEAYTDRQSIRYVWHDGYIAGIAPSGSNVTVSTESDDRDPRLAGVGPPWPVRGSEAMQFAYDNDGSITLYVPTYAEYTYSANANYYSEIAASTSGPNSLEIGQDWTVGGAKALSLWFYGDPNNDAEEMYVKLNGSKVVYDGDAGDIQKAEWQQWSIALSDFGVDLQNVTTVYIGFGDENNTMPGGSGVVFFDDIRLYPTRCVLSRRSPDFAKVDYVEDCVVDYKEVEVMAANWLEYASGDGKLMNFPSDDSQWVGGKKNNALQFDGIDDYVYIDCANEVSLQLTGDLTIAAWVKMAADNVDIYMGIAGKLASDPSYNGYALVRHSTNAFRFWVGSEGALEPVISDVNYTDTSWHHVAGVRRAGTNYLYVDGIEQADTNDVALSDSGHFASIGKQYANTDERYFNGLIDDVRFYDYALSNTEVANIANEIGDPVAGPLLWYKLDETSGDIAKESVGTVMYGLLPEPIDLYKDYTVDFKDFAELAAWWLDEVLWP